jgi:predicted dienelactone hydrolase
MKQYKTERFTKKQQNWWGTATNTLFGILSSLAISTPGLAADRIEFSYPPFGDFAISTNDLEIFATSGKITSDFAFYANRANPEQLAQLRQFLKTKFEVNPTLVSQFTYSPIGEKIVQRLGELLQLESRQNGFYALRSSLILSASSREGLTFLNIIRRYPSPSIRLNVSEAQDTFGQLSDLLQKRDKVVLALQELATQDTGNKAQPDFSKQPDIRQKGSFSYTKSTLELHDTNRDGQSGTILERKYSVDLYLPQQSSKSTASAPYPVIVISHGLAEDRNTFGYLAQHLASYGFAVAALDHPVSNSKEFQQFLSGFAGPPQAAELINRPLDVKYLLDELQRRNETDPNLKRQLNLQQVGVVGHSLGGYTALGLAGGKLDFEKIKKDCESNRSLNLSVFLQCRASEIQPGNYQIQDDRVKAVIAMNPLSSTVFGRKGISQIKIPVMLVGGSQDIFTPTVPEQIFPFTWLPNPDKYLAIIENATHFTVEYDPPNNRAIPVPAGLLGPDRQDAYTYMKALSLAFFETNLRNQQDKRPYLSDSYAKFISKAPLNLTVVNSGATQQITQLLTQIYPNYQQQTPVNKNNSQTK